MSDGGQGGQDLLNTVLKILGVGFTILLGLISGATAYLRVYVKNVTLVSERAILLHVGAEFMHKDLLASRLAEIDRRIAELRELRRNNGH